MGLLGRERCESALRGVVLLLPAPARVGVKAVTLEGVVAPVGVVAEAADDDAGAPNTSSKENSGELVLT